jgi:16S rRNA (uracil1498-N3)-methyltransferase
MHRFYLPPEQTGSGTIRLEGREAHHAVDVLRLRRGDTAEILNGSGEIFTCEVVEADKSKVAARVMKHRLVPRPPWQITLFQALPKGKNFDLIVEKATELGAAQVVPILTERVVTTGENSEHKVERWKLTAIDAIKQCGSPWLPSISTPLKFAEALKLNPDFEMSLVGSLHPGAKHPRVHLDKLDILPPASLKIALWIGPEGDFTSQEINDLIGADTHPISLGSLVLRVETAAIYALSVVSSEMQWRCPPETQRPE